MIKRKAYKQVKDAMNNYRIPILFGLRRIGKTTILKQFQEEYKDAIIINWELFDLQTLNDVDFYNFIKGKCEEHDILLFDEVQSRKGWDIMIKNLFDEFVDYKKCKIVVTGSSSLLLSHKELGLNRTKRIYLNTWDFDEFLELTGKERNIENFEDFLGRGFPDFINHKLENICSEASNDIILPIIKEDIPNAFPNIDTTLLLRFLPLLVNLTNGEVNENILSKNSEISIITVRKYIDILVQTNLMKKVFKINEKGKFARNKKYKIYLNPHLHIWLLKTPFSKLEERIKGHIIESYWLHSVLSRNNFRKEFYYLKDSKTNKEIDFVSLNPDGSFKTLHEFKYRNKINISDVKNLLSIESKNKIIWSKFEDTNKELPVKTISIININDN